MQVKTYSQSSARFLKSEKLVNLVCEQNVFRQRRKQQVADLKNKCPGNNVSAEDQTASCNDFRLSSNNHQSNLSNVFERTWTGEENLFAPQQIVSSFSSQRAVDMRKSDDCFILTNDLAGTRQSYF